MSLNSTDWTFKKSQSKIIFYYFSAALFLWCISGEKRSSLLAEVSRLREERSSETGGASGEDKEDVSQQPCRGTVSITNIQLPLKFEFVCSSHSRTGKTAKRHICYFLVCCVVRSLVQLLYLITKNVINTNLVIDILFKRTVFVLVQVDQVTTFSSWSATGPATSSLLHWPQLLMLRMETPSPSPPLWHCKLQFTRINHIYIFKYVLNGHM